MTALAHQVAKPAGMEVDRPVLRWHGAKWRDGKRILSHFPPHTCFVETHGGSGALILQKNPSKIEVYNDLDGEVVNFFSMLRENSEELARLIRLTPYALEEMRASREPHECPMERARRFAVSCWMKRGGRYRGGWRFDRKGKNRSNKGSALCDWKTLPETVVIAGQRFLEVQIECHPAENVIARFDSPETLFYVDPPYPKITRERSWASYKHEMTDQAHRDLAGVLHHVVGMVLLSSYHSDLYSELYADWHLVDSWTTQTNSNGRKIGHEFLWANRAAFRGCPQNSLTFKDLVESQRP